MEQAKSENLIVCLPTGSGKTYIAVMLIKEMAHEIRKSINDGGKRTIFLVKTGMCVLIIIRIDF
jgi:endoribonuclease Dicer